MSQRLSSDAACLLPTPDWASDHEHDGINTRGHEHVHRAAIINQHSAIRTVGVKHNQDMAHAYLIHCGPSTSSGVAPPALTVCVRNPMWLSLCGWWRSSPAPSTSAGVLRQRTTSNYKDVRLDRKLLLYTELCMNNLTLVL